MVAVFSRFVYQLTHSESLHTCMAFLNGGDSVAALFHEKEDLSIGVKPRAADGATPDTITHSFLPYPRTLLFKAVQSGKRVILPNVQKYTRGREAEVRDMYVLPLEDPVQSAMIIPLNYHDRPFGALMFQATFRTNFKFLRDHLDQAQRVLMSSIFQALHNRLNAQWNELRQATDAMLEVADAEDDSVAPLQGET